MISSTFRKGKMCNKKESFKNIESECDIGGSFLQALITKILPENKHVTDKAKQ